jgi:hypothetical protein
VQPRCDGGDGRLLEAGLACALRRFRADFGQCGPYPQCSGPQKGRKSDANDATWIADLLAHGLVRASFVPPQPIQELRDLTRTRRELTREIVRHKQRIQAVLEEANI